MSYHGGKRGLPGSLTISGAGRFKRQDWSSSPGNEFSFCGSKSDVSNLHLNTPQKAVDIDFKRRMVLGAGSFAKVLLVEKTSGSDKGQVYAMKVLDKKNIIKQKQTSHTMTERSVLAKTFDHPFIVSLKYAYQTKSTLNFVMDLCAGGELYFHMTQLGKFSIERTTFYVAELLLALKYLHSFNVVYRDLKPENVLIASDGHIKLADFGLSKEGIIDDCSGALTFCGTPEYLAPEILNRQHYGTAVDWWSLGMITFEMLTGLPPWYSKNRHEMFQGICFGELRFPGGGLVTSEAEGLIRGLLTRDPKERTSFARDLHNHSFFDGLSFDALQAKQIEAPWIPQPKKLYFDATFIRMPCDDPVPNHGMDVQEGGAVNEMNTVSPVYGSSFVERAFSGFSFTAPSHLDAAVQSPPRKLESRLNGECMNRHEQSVMEESSNSCELSPGLSPAIIHQEDDCMGQFNLEMDENL